MSIRHRNVSRATVQVRHIPRSNLHSWLHQTTDSITPAFGDVVMTQSLDLRSKPNETSSFALDFAHREEVAQDGVYEVQIAGGGKEDFLRVQVTDLNLIAKKEDVSEQIQPNKTVDCMFGSWISMTMPQSQMLRFSCIGPRV